MEDETRQNTRRRLNPNRRTRINVNANTGTNGRRRPYNNRTDYISPTNYENYDPNNYGTNYADYPRNSYYSDSTSQDGMDNFDAYEKEVQNIIYESYNQNKNQNLNMRTENDDYSDVDVDSKILFLKFLEQSDINLLINNTNLFSRSNLLQEKIAPHVFYSEQFKNFLVNLLGTNKYESIIMFNIQYHKPYIIKLTSNEKYYEIEKNGIYNYKKFLIDVIGNNEYDDIKKYYTPGFPFKHISCIDDLINLCQTFFDSEYTIKIATKSEMITHILSSKLSQIKITNESQMRKLYNWIKSNPYKIQAFKNYASYFVVANGSSLDTQQYLYKFIESLPGLNKKDLFITARIALLGDNKFASNFDSLSASCKKEILSIINCDVIYKFVCGSALVSTDIEMKIFSFLVQKNDKYNNMIFLSEYLNIVDCANINNNNDFEKMILFYKINCNINFEEFSSVTINADIIRKIKSILTDYDIKNNNIARYYNNQNNKTNKHFSRLAI